MTFRSILFIILIPIVFGINKELVDFAVKQYTKVTQNVKTGVEYPGVGDPLSDHWKTSDALSDWIQGFYPGILWHLYNYTKSDNWKSLAIKATDGLFETQFLNSTHDIGFMIICSYGIGYDLTKNTSYPKVIANAAHHLAMRYSPRVGCTRSWGTEGDKEFVVIVDNMMNLELLFRGYEITGNKTLYDMAVSHANRTIKEHLRKDYSSFQVVAYNESDGSVIRKYTAQGYKDWSCWSTGQSWLISGFTTTFRYTKSKHFLEAAENVSNYYIDHLPEDGIAYWDFDVPHDEHNKTKGRDTTSASIAASGLFELYEHTKNEKYLKTAKKIMDSLSAPNSEYRADGRPEYKIPALLASRTTAENKVYSTIFGDYYYMKALLYY